MCARSNATARPDLGEIRAAAVVGAYLTVRTGSLLLTFTSATAIASRLGDVQIAAHQIAWQLWWFLALCLDAIAIAGQAIVGRSLGASDAAGTRAAARRMMQWGVIVGVACAAARARLRSAASRSPSRATRPCSTRYDSCSSPSH